MPSDPVRNRESTPGVSRRAFLETTAVAGAGAAALGGRAAGAAETGRAAAVPATASRAGLLYPRQNQHRNVVDLSGLWQFQLDPKEEGEAARWFDGLPAPRTIAVPCSWNDLFDDARDYLGLAWYRTEVWVPQGWRGERVFLRVGSANYAGKVWVNGTLVAEHLGGHLPFAADITDRIAWDRPTAIAISVENKQLPERVPAGPSRRGRALQRPDRRLPRDHVRLLPVRGTAPAGAALLGARRRTSRTSRWSRPSKARTGAST